MVIEKPKILFIYPKLRSFVKKDIELLSDKYDVVPYKSYHQNKLILLFVLLKDVLYYILNMHRFKAVVIFFAGHHSFFPSIISKLFGVKSLIIVGGTDAANMPEIDYGNFRKRLLAFTTSKSFKNCSLIAPVHDVLEEFDYTYTNLKYKKQGVKAFVKNLKTPFQTVENGYDAQYFNMHTPWKSRSRHFLTIGTDFHLFSTYSRKGIDLILESATKLPDYTFTVVGLPPDAPYRIPPNVFAAGKIPFQDVLKYCNNHKFYLQLSMMEGLPNALCEAMLCGCIPVVSDMGSLPMVIGNSGYILNTKSVEEFLDLVEEIDFDRDEKSHKARQRIKNNYPIARRKSGLEQAMKILLQ